MINGVAAHTAAMVRERASLTPASRERHVDLLRAFAICMVVLGHWLITVVWYHDGELSGRNALGVLSWTHPVTWVFQVMPIFFLVGGFSNAASLISHRRAGGDAVSWVLHRTDRLLRPSTALLVTIPVAAIVAVLAGVDKNMVGRAAWLVCMPLWFLLAYLVMVVLAPWMHALHRRAGLKVVALLVVAVAVCDVLRMGLDVPYVGSANYVFAWLAIHQLGFSWQDGRLNLSQRLSWAIAAGGLAALVLLTLVGPYAIQMVSKNTDPPSLALLALATTQVGIVFALRDRSNRWLQRTRPWTVVVGLNAVVLTLFLWHMTAALLVAVLVYPSGILPHPAITSAAWLPWRLPWLMLCALALVVLVIIFSRIELRSGRGAPAAPSITRDALTVAGLVVMLGGGLLGVALAGPGYHGPGGLPPVAVLAYLAGVAMLRAARRGWRPHPGRSTGVAPSTAP